MSHHSHPYPHPYPHPATQPPTPYPPTSAPTHSPADIHTHSPADIHTHTHSPAYPNSIFGECKNDKKYFKTLRTFGPSSLSCSALAKIQNETILYVFQEFVDMRSMYVVTLLLPSCDNILGKWTWPKIV